MDVSILSGGGPDSNNGATDAGDGVAALGHIWSCLGILHLRPDKSVADNNCDHPVCKATQVLENGFI